jgi:hypothetical protein
MAKKYPHDIDSYIQDREWSEHISIAGALPSAV